MVVSFTGGRRALGAADTFISAPDWLGLPEVGWGFRQTGGPSGLRQLSQRINADS
jgi:hypothetical protein